MPRPYSTNLSDAYLYTVARSVGVPEMFLEDCAQELRIAEWQGRVIRTAAIDFVRQFGRHSRKGIVRDYGYIDGSESLTRDFTDTSDRIIDLERAWPRLTEKQRTALVKNINSVVGKNTEYVTCFHARQKLRKAC